MKALKTRILSLRMDQDDILDIHKWVLCRFQEDGTVSVEIDREAMREDGYTITERDLLSIFDPRQNSLRQSAMDPNSAQRLAAQSMGPRPIIGSLFGTGII